MKDWIFAFFHMFLLIGVVLYALYALIIGNTTRFAVLALGLVIYYFLVLHKAVRKEIARKRKQ